ncbi:hypothetical protein EIP91_008999 [Steccherinum ochraceum]|uniref:Uncharacterized protein n=1 Tax=Steccherinum ochraceum TaxID=92696 RepID=A0A4R0RFG2_9APHY|nr:hypothetical protein EIP91_008999 [Steccherinum ochraceum]
MATDIPPPTVWDVVGDELTYYAMLFLTLLYWLSVALSLFLVGPMDFFDIEAAVHLGHYPSLAMDYFHSTERIFKSSFTSRLVYLWGLLLQRSLAHSFWFAVVSCFSAAFEIKLLLLVIAQWQHPSVSNLVGLLLVSPLCIGFDLLVNSYRAVFVRNGLHLFQEAVGLWSFTERELKHLHRVRLHVKHYVLGMGPLGDWSCGSKPVVVYAFRRPRQVTVVLETVCERFACGFSQVESPETFSSLLDGTLEVDGYKVRWDVFSDEDDLRASVALHLWRYRFMRWLTPRGERIPDYPPRRYLNTSPDGTLASSQTLDGVPPSLLSPVLKSLVALLQPGSAVTLDFSALGPAMPSIFRSSLLVATSLALDSHSYVRHRLLDDAEAAKTMEILPTCTYYDSTLPLFLTANTVARALRCPGVEITLRNASADHVETLKTRVAELERSLPSGGRHERSAARFLFIHESTNGRREMFLHTHLCWRL